MEKTVYRIKDLDNALNGTIMKSFVKAFVKQISDNIKGGKENNFVLNNIDSLAFSESRKEKIPGLKEKLLEKYNEVFSEGYSYVIPDVIKVSQAMLMDSLVFGYNLNTGNIGLYTMNIKALFNLGIDTPKLLSKCFNCNTLGILHAYRIDIEYDSRSTIIYKAVNLNKNSCLYASDYCFFPYEYVNAAMILISSWLEKGFTFKITQNIEGMSKFRYVSCKESVLAKYCDDPEVVKGLEVNFFPLKGYMYLPVLGAPSITSMLTKVDLFVTDTISPVKGYDDIKVEKVKDPLKSVILKSALCKRLSELYLSDDWAYISAIDSIPRSEQVFKDPSQKYLVNIRNLSKYLDSLKFKELEDVCKNVEGTMDVVERMTPLLTKKELVDISGLSNKELRSLLSKGIYSFICIGKSCRYYNIIVTNNRDLLKKMYGDDYFARCEGFNVKWIELKRILKYSDTSIEDALSHCGFPVDDDFISACKDLKESLLENSDSDISVVGGSIKDSIISKYDIREKSESSTDSILCRTCFGVVEPDGTVSDYYKYLRKDRVVRAIRLG